MASYEDANGRKWRIELDGFLMRRIKQEIGINICDLVGSEDAVPQLLQDIEKVIDTIWICVEEQAVAAKVDEIEFAKGFKGDYLGSATDCLLDAVVDFFPSPAQREASAALLKKGREMGKALTEAATEAIERVELADLKSTANSGATPELSASTGSGKPTAN